MNRENYTMKQLPASEKPYEKCLRDGAGALSDAELLAVVIKTGTRHCTSLQLAIRLLQLHPCYPGLLGLQHLGVQELTQVKGVGTVKAIQLLCVVELSKRLARQTRNRTCRLTCPEDAAGYFMEEMRCLETEHLYAAFLDAGGRLLHYRVIFMGSVKTSIASPREILRMALQYDAAQYLVLHNHPSGDPEPSPDDVQMTRKLKKASDLVGIPLMDHIIIGDNRYISLSDRGYL